MVSRSLLGVAAVALAALCGCSAGTGEGGPAGLSEAAVAAAEERAALSAAFPSVDPLDPRGVLAVARANFDDARRVEVSTRRGSGPGSVERVVLSRGGVHSLARMGNRQVETIVLDASSGWVRGGEEFWLERGMSEAASTDAAGRWVETVAVATPQQAAPAVRGELGAELVRGMGEPVGEVSLVDFQGEPAVLVEHEYGQVVAAGDPLVPVELLRFSGPDPVEVTFVYEGVQPVVRPARAVALGTVVYQ